MAKKIKKRSKKSPEEEAEQQALVPAQRSPELLDADGAPRGDASVEQVKVYDEVVDNFGDMVVNIPEHERDTFEKLSHGTANWIERNRPLAIALVVLVLAAPLLIYFAVVQVERAAIEDSNQVTEAIEAYQYPVEGSSMMQLFEQNDKFARPETVYPTLEAKWQAVYQESDEALKAHGASDLGVAARYTKAGAAYQLGKYEEAASLYSEVLGDERGSALHLFATLGLAMSQAGNNQADEAAITFDQGRRAR